MVYTEFSPFRPSFRGAYKRQLKVSRGTNVSPIEHRCGKQKGPGLCPQTTSLGPRETDGVSTKRLPWTLF